jgi:ribosomal protein S18 acetylase RimI-like enzyme
MSAGESAGAGGGTPEIRRLAGGEEAAACARMMATSEPWVTLGRDEATALTLLTDPQREAYGAFVDGRLAGFVLLVMRGAFVGYIQSVCVAPGLRGHGVGSRLMAFAEARILRETPNVFLCVSSFNPDARRLYERLGYEVVGPLRDYVVPGHDEILMRKTTGPLARFRPA